jgi:hypothetical protein
LEILNLRLMSHPFNWLFVWIVLALFSIAYTIIHNELTQGQVDGSVSPD